MRLSFSIEANRVKINSYLQEFIGNKKKNPNGLRTIKAIQKTTMKYYIGDAAITVAA